MNEELALAIEPLRLMPNDRAWFIPVALDHSEIPRLAIGAGQDSSEGSEAEAVLAIPVAAVSRIEIITGGAAALYGSDAGAGLINIILRPDFRGLELSETLGEARSGGGFLQRYNAIAGNDWRAHSHH
jgi:outer membrane receptor protein involved in Fe transport